MFTQGCVQADRGPVEIERYMNQTPVHLPHGEAQRGWSNMAAPLRTVGPTMHHSGAPGETPYG